MCSSFFALAAALQRAVLVRICPTLPPDECELVPTRQRPSSEPYTLLNHLVSIRAILTPVLGYAARPPDANGYRRMQLRAAVELCASC